MSPRGRGVVATIVVGLLTAIPARAQSARDSLPPGNCWRFSFGGWTPPLDWSRAGHSGDSATMEARMRRLRDSIFVRDTAAVNSNAMQWEHTSEGWRLLLFPPWWPVGVLVTFDSVVAPNGDMTGEAVALVAHASREPSRARVRARNACQ